MWHPRRTSASVTKCDAAAPSRVSPHQNAGYSLYIISDEYIRLERRTCLLANRLPLKRHVCMHYVTLRSALTPRSATRMYVCMYVTYACMHVCMYEECTRPTVGDTIVHHYTHMHSSRYIHALTPRSATRLFIRYSSRRCTATCQVQYTCMQVIK